MLLSISRERFLTLVKFKDKPFIQGRLRLLDELCQARPVNDYFRDQLDRKLKLHSYNQSLRSTPASELEQKGTRIKQLRKQLSRKKASYELRKSRLEKEKRIPSNFEFIHS